MATNVPRLHHLHLRYCKRITDAGINAITYNMPNLHSLDLSFCSRITSSSIFHLLECLHETLSELRLRNCGLLDIFSTDDGPGVGSNGGNVGLAGNRILNGIRSHGSGNCLCLLDVRGCGGIATPQQNYPESDPFVHGMSDLQFQQRVPGFFSRKAQWNAGVQRRLVQQVKDMGGSNYDETGNLN